MTTTRTRKPTLRTGPASHYAGPGEIIREFSDGRSGGLLSIRRNPVTDRLHVELYRMDADVDVVTPALDAAHHEIHDESCAPETPEDLNPGESLGEVHVFGRTLTPEQAEAFGEHLRRLAHTARVAAATYPTAP